MHQEDILLLFQREIKSSYYFGWTNQSFQAFRPGILRRRSKQENPGDTFLPLPTIKDELIIVTERLETVS
jgi:hypothetical protein